MQASELARAHAFRLPTPPPSAAKLALMHWIDKLHLEHRYMVSRSIQDQLNRQGIAIPRGRVNAFMCRMGITAFYKEPSTTIPNVAPKVYPYLLHHCAITRPHEVWYADITQILMARRFAYLVAVMDRDSLVSFVLETVEYPTTDFYTDALENGIACYGRPETFNTDKGSQFTSGRFTEILRQVAPISV